MKRKKNDRTEIAHKFGVDPSNVSRWVRAGCPRDDDGLFDEKAVRAWLRSQRKRKPSSSIRAEDAQEFLFCQIHDQRIEAAMELGLIANNWAKADSEMLLVDIRETLTCYRDWGDPNMGIELMGKIVSLLQDFSKSYEGIQK